MEDLRVEPVGADRLDTCFALRRTVFVQGQGVSEREEIDGLDEECTHFLAWRGGEPVGTARLRFVEGTAKAERVAVLEAARRSGAGRALMEALEREAARRGAPEVMLHAQLASLPFYERLGYRAEGETFMEAEIPHRRMRKPVDDGAAG